MTKPCLRLIVLVAVMAAAHAADPVINYQGRLVESGVAVTATRTIQCSILSGTVAAWTGPSTSVTVTDGLYALPLTLTGITPAQLGAGNLKLRVKITNASNVLTTLTPDITLLPALSAYAVVDGGVTSAAIASNAITGAKILDGTITNSDLASSSVTGSKIATGTITSSDLAAGAATTAVIADGAVTTAKLADSAVTGAKIVDGTITGSDLASNSVTGAKIANGTITAADLASTALSRPAVYVLLYKSPAVSVPLTATDSDGNGWVKVPFDPSNIAQNAGMTFDDAADAITITQAGVYSMSLHGQLTAGKAIANQGTPQEDTKYNRTRLELDVLSGAERLRFLEVTTELNGDEGHRSSSIVFPLKAGDKVYLISGYSGAFATGTKVAGTYRDVYMTVTLIHATP